MLKEDELLIDMGSIELVVAQTLLRAQSREGRRVVELGQRLWNEREGVIDPRGWLVEFALFWRCDSVIVGHLSCSSFFWFILDETIIA